MIKKVERIIDGKPRDVWVYDIRLGGRRLRTPRDSYFTTRDECRDAVDAIRADYRRGIYRFPADEVIVSLKEVRDEWMKKLKRNNSHPSTIRRAERSFCCLSLVIPLSSSVMKLTDKHLERLVGLREAANIKTQTIFADLTPILAALKQAVKKYPELKGWQPPERPTHIAGKKSRRNRVITLDEERAILSELRRPPEGVEARYKTVREQTADVFETALRTAMRVGEIFALRWSDVYFDRSPGHPHGWILVRATKTGDRSTDSTDDRVVPISPALHALLLRRKAVSTSEWVFPAHGTRKAEAGHQTQMFWAFKKACERARVLHGRFTPGGLVFHDTRHTAVTRMLQAGHDLRTVMDIAGHKSVTTAMIYAHSTAGSRYAAVESADFSESSLSPSNMHKKPIEAIETKTAPDDKHSIKS